VDAKRDRVAVAAPVVAVAGVWDAVPADRKAVPPVKRG
jgi:hypothetical protein